MLAASRNLSGDYVAASKKFRIGQSIQQRNKRLLDILLAILFSDDFPVQFPVSTKEGIFFQEHAGCAQFGKKHGLVMPVQITIFQNHGPALLQAQRCRQA